MIGELEKKRGEYIMKRVRTFEVLTESEKERLKLYERKIIMGKTPIDIYVNKRRALRLLDQAKKRYLRNEESN